MKQKKWKHCPVCGAKGSMHFKKSLTQKIRLKGYPLLAVRKLQGYECRQCREAILNIRTCRHVDRLVGEHKARIDSERIVAARLTEVAAMKKQLGVSRQRVHQLMISGKIPYVFIGHTRVPVRSAA
ncbi:MAG: YgiT-type zinc finger protein [Deltaproteobacteria bacterium]|nr:YgiT-type zinc finger protein [Deltaproteobacteria bacterium]